MFGLTPYRKNQGLSKHNNNIWDIDNIFENFFNDTMFPAFFSNSSQMKVDIRELENEYVVEVELPGVNKDDVNIELDDNHLTISVQKNEQVDEENNSYIRRERKQCSMARSFYVENVDNDRVEAKYYNGLLSITLPKKEPGSPKTKKIQIT